MRLAASRSGRTSCASGLLRASARGLLRGAVVAPLLSPALLLGAALALPACASDDYSDPLPGHEAKVVLLPEDDRPFRANWPVPWRRGAEFRIENRTGKPVETLILDFGEGGRPRELDRIEVIEPVGPPAYILPYPHGEWAIRARLGDPGTVLVEPGASLLVRVHVMGVPGGCHVKVTIPGVTVE